MAAFGVEDADLPGAIVGHDEIAFAIADNGGDPVEQEFLGTLQDADRQRGLERQFRVGSSAGLAGDDGHARRVDDLCRGRRGRRVTATSEKRQCCEPLRDAPHQFCLSDSPYRTCRASGRCEATLPSQPGAP